MQTFNTHYTAQSEFKHFIETHKIINGENILIQVFTSLNNEENIALLLNDITSVLPSAHLIGATTDGEIFQDQVTTYETIISITVFETTKLRSTLICGSLNSDDIGRELANALIDEDTKVIITFTDGLHCNGEKYLQGIASVNKNTKIAGGMAGDYAQFQNTYVFTKDQIISNGAVGVSLSNPTLQIYTDYNFNWLSIGKDMLITKAQGNRVYTIDGIPAYDVYKKYLGEETAQELPAIGIEYPLVIAKENKTIARAVLAAHDDGSLTFAGDLNEGDVVHFGYGDALSIINYSLISQQKLLNQSIETIFLYSCMARRRFMPDLIEKEIEPFSKIAPTAGFFTYGEFFSNELLNQTLTILALSESIAPITKIACVDSIPLHHNDYQKSIRALSHLLNATIKDLNEENNKLINSSKELHTKEESLRLAQEIGHFGSWEIDLITKESIWSQESYHIYRVDKSTKPTLDTFISKILEKDRIRAFQKIEEMKDGFIQSIELQVKRDDGVIINVLINGKMIFNDAGIPIKMVGTTLDITEISKLKETNKELISIVQNSSNEIYILDRKTYIYKYINQQVTEKLGYSYDEMMQMNIFDINPFLTMQDVKVLENEVVKRGNILNRTVHKKKDGTLYHVQSYIQYTQFKGEDVAIIFDIDITELIESEKKQKEQALILEQIHDSVVTTDLNGVIIHWNNGATVMHGYSPEEIVGKSINMIYPKASLEKLQSMIHLTLVGGSCRDEIQKLSKSGSFIETDTALSLLKDDNGQVIGIIEFSQDITQKKEVEIKLQKQTELLNHQAYHDHLTNLPNRLLFEDRLEQSIAKSKREDANFALLFIDLDNFKEINDTLGHNIGDKVLQMISKKLSTCVRAEDSLSRLGGDEFTIILQNIKSPNSAAEVAQKLLDLISTKITINNNEIYLSASIGISLSPKDSTNKSDLIKFADSAMYKAKDNGKNSYQFYSSNMTEIAFEKIMLQNNMRTAISNEEFHVYYQPQVDAKNKLITGMEALVRWRHPDLGLIAPYKFIPLAEESGFIIHLDNYVMKQAMKDFVQWYGMGLSPGILSLNLSIKQLNHDDFLRYLIASAQETGFNFKWLELEITETQMMQDPLSAIEKLNIISNMGIEIAIDDFGTGYSSLAYLKRLPVDKLKIDKSFVDNLPEDEEDCAISKAVIALGKSLNLKIIAEGVETKEQKEFLVENGCENIQGYYYSRPIPKEEMELFLQKPSL
jgi:diguanylate cyclase (GGDEF)-like protein/PAS domain S-box-containing protein